MDDVRAVLVAAGQAAEGSEPFALVTVVSTQGSVPRDAGAKMLVRHDGSAVGTIGGGAMEADAVREALAALQDGLVREKTYTLNSLEAGDPGICGGTLRVVIDPVRPAPRLLVIGGGHVGSALCELAKWAGFQVILSDDRSEYCGPHVVPDLAGYLVCDPVDIVSRTVIDERTYVAAVTRGLPVDERLLPALLATKAPYVGLIGSKRRIHLTRESLAQGGLGLDSLNRLRAPIGLDIEAQTPREIAVSILAEIIMTQRGGSGRSMSQQDT